jgi:uncharacterized protein YigA (DUF484 family)
MTIDERLERLAERHESLSQAVELLAGMQRENEERFARNEERLARLMDAMTRLIGVVENHERRLERPEGQ